MIIDLIRQRRWVDAYPRRNLSGVCATTFVPEPRKVAYLYAMTAGRGSIVWVMSQHEIVLVSHDIPSPSASCFFPQLQTKLLAPPKFIYRAGYVAERLPKMMACRFASPNGLLRSSKALSQYRLPSSLLLSWPSPRRSQQDEDDAHPHRPGH